MSRYTWTVDDERLQCVGLRIELETKMVLLGEERDSIYPMLDYTNNFSSAIQYNLVLIFGVQTVFFLLLFLVSTIKHKIHKKLIQQNLNCIKKQN